MIEIIDNDNAKLALMAADMVAEMASKGFEVVNVPIEIKDPACVNLNEISPKMRQQILVSGDMVSAALIASLKGFDNPYPGEFLQPSRYGPPKIGKKGKVRKW